jgi:hypothetical protein
VLGAAEACASIRENAHQMRLGHKVQRHLGLGHIVHGANEVQVRERASLDPAGLIDRWDHAVPRALRGRGRFPPFLRRVRIGFEAPLGRRAAGLPDGHRLRPRRVDAPHRHLPSQLAETDPEARALIAAGFARWSSAIGDGLRSLQAAGHLPAGVTPDDLAVTRLAALQGGLLLAQIQRDTRPLETAVDTILALAATR